jgi:acyl-coenzyme A thioesterase PaaI-like protein
VVRPGATVTVCKGDVLAYDGDEEKLVATMLMTIMTMPDRPDLAG